jgi:hypothetical protein
MDATCRYLALPTLWNKEDALWSWRHT